MSIDDYNLRFIVRNLSRVLSRSKAVDTFEANFSKIFIYFDTLGALSLYGTIRLVKSIFHYSIADIIF